MNSKLLCTGAALGMGIALLAIQPRARGQANEPASPYGGTVVEDKIARVNDQIITKSDYDRAMNDLDQEARGRGESMQQMASERKDLLRNLIDQQLWLSKGKELDITGETELIKKLDEIRKQYNLDSMEDLEKAAREQGVSFEDFKANIRNGIITQEVMRQEVGEKIQMTPGEVERYYQAHKQDYTQPESERLSEILISTGTGDDPAKVKAAKAKADDIEARLNSGGDFAQLSRSFSDGSTAAGGGDLGVYKRSQLPKVLEDKTFDLKSGQYTEPILTRQGYIILKVVQHTPGGPRPFKDVEDDVEQAYYMSLMEPAIRAYLSKMRDEAFIEIKPGYTDTGATYAELHPSITFSAYTPPAPKKKAKVERTRFRESTHTFRQKAGAAPGAAGDNAENQSTPSQTTAATSKKDKKAQRSTEKPGKKEKIRYGQAPRETLPAATSNSATEDAGAVPAAPDTASNADQPANPLEPTAVTKKSRFSDRARDEKKTKSSGAPGAQGPTPPDAAEVADRQTQSAPLGMGNDNSTNKKKQKKPSTNTGEKTRLANQKKNQSDATTPPKPAPQPTPIPAVPGAPAPADAPQPQQTQPQP